MVCLTPVVIAAWPSIVSCVAGAAAALGFTAVSSVVKQKVETELDQTAEVEVEVDSVLEGYTGEELKFVREGVTLTIRTNQDGRLVVRAKGSESKQVLEQKALTFTGKLQQVYSYNKAMTQLRQSGFNVVDESVGHDQQIHIILRRC
jgi:hypothetical protein